MSGLHVTALKLSSLSLCLLTLAGITLVHGSGDVKVVVKEGSDAVLPCSLSTKESISAELFDWKKAAQKDEKKKEVFFYDAGIHYNNGRSGQSEEFKGRVFHFSGELRHGNASIIINNTKVTDSGKYTCDFPLLAPRPTFHIELVVEPVFKDRSGENPAATPKPYVTILDATDDWELLQCEVRGASPKPHLQWQDRDGNKLPAEEPQISEREGHYYITLNTRMTKTDLYSCVVTQEEISHQTHTEIFVYISEKVSEDSFGEVAIISIVLGACIVTFVAVSVLLVAMNRIKILHNRGSRLQGTSWSHQRNLSCKDSTELHLKSRGV